MSSDGGRKMSLTDLDRLVPIKLNITRERQAALAPDMTFWQHFTFGFEALSSSFWM